MGKRAKADGRDDDSWSQGSDQAHERQQLQGHPLREPQLRQSEPIQDDDQDADAFVIRPEEQHAGQDAPEAIVRVAEVEIILRVPDPGHPLELQDLVNHFHHGPGGNETGGDAHIERILFLVYPSRIGVPNKQRQAASVQHDLDQVDLECAVPPDELQHAPDGGVLEKEERVVVSSVAQRSKELSRNQVRNVAHLDVHVPYWPAQRRVAPGPPLLVPLRGLELLRVVPPLVVGGVKRVEVARRVHHVAQGVPNVAGGEADPVGQRVPPFVFDLWRVGQRVEQRDRSLGAFFHDLRQIAWVDQLRQGAGLDLVCVPQFLQKGWDALRLVADEDRERMRRRRRQFR
mmetsp:Transcript_37814/g.114220  ORF Transcript_37814/g.114220 Transcript_37814/m.114220 type:complete len:344 (+) Transcript_37814:1070-2101(+)